MLAPAAERDRSAPEAEGTIAIEDARTVLARVRVGTGISVVLPMVALFK